jgi:hypothetical protein
MATPARIQRQDRDRDRDGPVVCLVVSVWVLIADVSKVVRTG